MVRKAHVLRCIDVARSSSVGKLRAAGPAGWFGDWHPAPHRQFFFFFLVGEFEIRVSDGAVRRFGPGSILFVEDTTGREHTTRNVGDDAMVAVVQLAES